MHLDTIDAIPYTASIIYTYTNSLPVAETEEHDARTAKSMGLIYRESKNWSNVYLCVSCFG